MRFSEILLFPPNAGLQLSYFVALLLIESAQENQVSDDHGCCVVVCRCAQQWPGSNASFFA